MRGSGDVRFSELFADTVRTHGVYWAIQHYMQSGMEMWELLFWFRTYRLNGHAA